YTAVATDDGDVSGGVSFSLSADSAAGVEIDAVSGEVSLTAAADFETAESYSFTVVATDVAGNKTTKAVAVDVTNLDEVAPVITSDATAEAIAENTAAGAVVYMATATDEGDISEGVTFSLADGSDAALSINAQTGAVTLNESPDFETQETYSFTVVATDGGGNTDDQAVTLAVSDVDDSQPTFTSATTGAALTSTPYLYQAEVDDSGDDISAGVTYRLADSGDSALLQIDPSDGVVSVKNGLVDPSIQDSYTFTVIADDGVTDPVSQTVTLTVPEPNTVLGLGVSEQGGVQIVDTDNGDGTITLEFFVADEFVSSFPNGVENYDFVINYDATQFEAIAGTDYSTDFALPTVNAEVAGRLVVGAIDLDPLDLATGEPLGQLVLTPVTQDSFTISVADVIVNETDLSGTVVIYGDTASVTGSDEPESFILAGGSAQITAGAGVDVFVVTSTTGNDLTITDYTEDDFVDFSYALISAGYNSNTDELTQSASTGEARLLLDPVLSDLTASNSALDNGYGAIVDADNGDIVTFYDENSAAGSVNVVVSRIAIGDVASTLSQVEIGAQVSTGAAFTSGATGGSVTENDTFTLLGGDTEITGGDGIDAYIVTETTGNQVYITDFMTDEDVIDMSSLLMGKGYNSISDLDLGPAVNGEAREYSQTSMDLLELVQANDFSFDNSFGMLIDETNGKIIGFYDADADADSIDMQTFEINIGSAATDITLDDLIAGIGGFIA
ncbi:MAG: cadherin domain-containing protein, partial [Halieaceae bacterium]|nr:cadherin domain-containing protein [Halieaceae bacterium]